MSKSIGLPIAAGLSSAVLYLMVVTGKPLGVLLIYLTPLPFLLLALSQGLLPAVFGAVVGLVAVAAVMLGAVPSYAVVAVLPSLALGRLALLWRADPAGKARWSDPGFVLAGLAVTGATLLLVLAAWLSSNGVGLEAVVTRHVGEFVDQVAGQIPVTMRESLAAVWSALFPAIAGFIWLTAAALNGALAQWIATRTKQALRPTPDYSGLDLPPWYTAVVAVTALLGLFGNGDVGYVGRNIAVLLLSVFVFAGFAATHRWLKSRNNGAILLGLFYVAFFVLFGWALIAIAGLGLVRHWTRLLRRKPAAGSQEE